MKIEEFIKECTKQILDAVKSAGSKMPSEIEFIIQINPKCFVCSENEICVSTLRVKI